MAVSSRKKSRILEKHWVDDAFAHRVSNTTTGEERAKEFKDCGNDDRFFKRNCF